VVVLVKRDEIREILDEYNVVAVVGISRDSSKDSQQVARYLSEHGYEIIPINPFADEIMNKKAYPTLLDLPEEIKQRVEIVDIFRPSKDVLPHVERAVELKKNYDQPKVIWMQLGIVNNSAADMAKKAGMKVVMDQCIMVEHKRWRARQKNL